MGEGVSHEAHGQRPARSCTARRLGVVGYGEAYQLQLALCWRHLDGEMTAFVDLSLTSGGSCA